jgi:hypothetical protein
VRDRLSIAVLCMVPLLGAWEWLTKPDPDVSRGNDSFVAGEFRAALESYERAKARGTAAELEFDIGTALYKLAESASDDIKKDLLERAESAFRRAADTSSGDLKSAAYYNLGNAEFLRERWPEAIDAYRKALRANQENDDARYNLELALRKLQRDKEPPPSSGQGQPQQGGGQGQQGQQGDQGQQGNQGQGQNQQGQQGQQGNPGQGQQGQKDQQGQSNPGQGQSDQNQSGQQGNQGGNRQQGNQNTAPNAPDSGGSNGTDDQNQPRNGADPGGTAGAGTDDRSERDRKLDALENRSRDLRRRRLRRGSRGSGNSRFGGQKDW